MKTQLTARENMLRQLRGERPAWLEYDVNNIHPRIVPDNIARAMVIEAEPVPEADGGGPDMFGVEWEYIPTVGGSMVRPGEQHWISSSIAAISRQNSSDTTIPALKSLQHGAMAR